MSSMNPGRPYPQQYLDSCAHLRRTAHLVLGPKFREWEPNCDQHGRNFASRVASGEVLLRLFLEAIPQMCPDLREQSVMRYTVNADASIHGAVENLSSFRSICQRCNIGPLFDLSRVLKGQVEGDFSKCIENFCCAVDAKYASEPIASLTTESSGQDNRNLNKANLVTPESAEPAEIGLPELYRMQKDLASSVARLENSVQLILDGMVDFFVKSQEMSQNAQRMQASDVRDSCGSLDTVTYPSDVVPLLKPQNLISPRISTSHQNLRETSIDNTVPILSTAILKNEAPAQNVTSTLPSNSSVATLRPYDFVRANPSAVSSPLRRRRTQSTSSLVSLAPTEYSVDSDDGMMPDTDILPTEQDATVPSSPTPSTISVATMFCPSLSPKKLPTEVKNKCRTKLELTRQKAIYEMIHTEFAFIDDVGLILDCVIPLLCNNVGEAAAEVAGNLCELLFNHKRIYDIWDEAAKEQGYIKNPGELFQKSLQFLEPHIHYTHHFTTVTSLRLRRPEIIDFSRHLSTLHHTGALGLDAHLIKPIQRVTKYRLMLREIRKSTYDDDPEIDLLEKVDLAYGELLNKVDAGGAQMDVASVGRKIQGFDQIKRCASSRFVKEGSLTLCNHSRKAPLPMHWFLFSDILIICKTASIKRTQQASHRIKFHFPTTRGLLFPRQFKNGLRLADFQIELLPIGTEKDYSDQGFLFGCQSEDERRSWLSAYQSAVEFHIKEEGYRFCLLPRRESTATKFLRPISSLVMQNEKRDEVGEFTSTGVLRSLNVTPETMDDTCEVIVVTTEDYTPKSKHEIGFYKNTLLRIVNYEDKQYLKVSMGNVQGLVHRNRVEECNDISSERTSYLISALREKQAACWIKNWAYCLPQSEQNGGLVLGANGRRSNLTYSRILGSLGEDEFEFENGHSGDAQDVPSQVAASQDRNGTLKTPRFSTADPFFPSESYGSLPLNLTKYATLVTGRNNWYEIAKPGCRAYYFCSTNRVSTWSLPGPDGKISQEELIKEPVHT